MVLAAVGLIMPAIFHELVGHERDQSRAWLESRRRRDSVARVCLEPDFSLVTHSDLYNPSMKSRDKAFRIREHAWGLKRSVVVLSCRRVRRLDE